LDIADRNISDPDKKEKKPMQLLPKLIAQKLETARQKLIDLENELAKDKAVWEEEQKGYSTLKILHAGKLKKPSSVQTRRRSVVEAKLEYDTSLDAVNDLQEKIADLEKQADLANFYSQQSQRSMLVFKPVRRLKILSRVKRLSLNHSWAS
jgi:hypothetical protein